MTHSAATLASAAPEARQSLLEEAVLREAPALLAYLSRRVQNPADAADLLGDVLVVVWRRIDAMPLEPGPARLWMFGIARKTLLGSHRSTRRRRALTDRLRHELSTVDTTADLSGVASPGLADPRTELVTAALGRLSPPDREILRLVHWDSFTVSEAAQHLRLRPATARSRYHRARSRLKRMLEAELREPSAPSVGSRRAGGG